MSTQNNTLNKNNGTLNKKFDIKIDSKRDDLLSFFGKSVLEDRYLLKGETFQELFARVASYYASDKDHAQRLYDYMSQLWFMPATPILSNGGTTRGLPISCFLNEVEDSLEDIVRIWNENVSLASKGGGIGTYWGNVRSINEDIANNGKTSGIIPFIKVQDSLTLAISQGSLRRGSSAVYLPVWHPEIIEFIEIRKPVGDLNRRALNIHHGVVICDEFMQAVENNQLWELKSPANGQVMSKISAREVWIKLLSTRIETGEPYILFIDRTNARIPEHHKKSNLLVKTSNLCSEITLPTGIDHKGKQRSAVCCLSSLNLEKFDEWHNDEQFILDIMRFLDNVLQDFIDRAPDSMANAKYSAQMERSVGLGVMGFCSFLQMKNVPVESVMSGVWNHKIFKHIKTKSDQASKILCDEKGPCPDAKEHGVHVRFSNTTAIAPTATISVICNNTSPGIDPFTANNFTQKTLSGSFIVKNKNLAKLLTEKNMNNEETWSSIATHEGSVQHLDFLSDHEKKVFKTAYEIDQRRLVRLAAERNVYISQSQSLNLFLRGDEQKQYLHETHYNAWKQGLKSMYYVRSTSIQRAEKVSHEAKYNKVESNQSVSPPEQEEDPCTSCQ